MTPATDIALVASVAVLTFLLGALVVMFAWIISQRKLNRQMTSMLPPPVNTGPEDLFKTLEVQELERLERLQ